MRRGWRRESYRHRLARYGIKTKGMTGAEIKQKHDVLKAQLKKKKKRKSFLK